MVWSNEQKQLLALERASLRQHFRFVTWNYPEENTEVEILFNSNSGREYTLRVYIPGDFPNSCPALVVVHPEILQQHNGNRVPAENHLFHTLEDTHGFHRICHYYPPDWTPNNTLYQVFMKGRLWIEAYEFHLETGRHMDEILGQQMYVLASEIPPTV